MTGPMEARSEWRNRHGITDWELGQVGRLLTEHDPRDLALRLVRLQGQYEVSKQLIATMTAEVTSAPGQIGRLIETKVTSAPGAAAGMSQNAASTDAGKRDSLPPLYHPDSERPPPPRPPPSVPLKKGT